MGRGPARIRGRMGRQTIYQMNKLDLPPVDVLCAYLRYDAGVLYWRNRLGNQAYRNGTVAGRPLRGTPYRIVKFFGRDYYEHRIVFKILNGFDPNEVDHKLPNGSNAQDNLRNATPSQNKANRKGTAKSGLKGVRQRGSKYEALITHEGTQRFLGSYDTAEEAHNAYAVAAQKLFGEFANTTHVNSKGGT